MVKSALQHELDGFFGVINNEPESLSASVTKSAYCQARKKFSASAFIELNQLVCDEFYQHSSHRRWRGHRLLAIDGSTLELPPSKELKQHFGKVNPQARRPGARLSELYDPLNNMTLDVQLSPCSIGERQLAKQHLEATSHDDIVLYDRGYPAVWLLALHLDKGIHCCMRSPWNLYNETRDFLLSGEQQQIVTLPVSKTSREACRELGLSEDPVTVRLIRVDLPDSDEQEVLITTLLDGDAYPAEDFAWLYHQRWFVEEDYKSLKSKMELENFSGYSKTAVEQDVHATVVTKNLAAILALQAQGLVEEQDKARNRARCYKMNFANALRKWKDNIVRLLRHPTPQPLIKGILQAFSREAEAVRPDRKHERLFKRAKARFTMQYKRV